MGQMEKLGLLDLANYSITGSIPCSLGNLSQLRYLYLSQNNLSGNIPIKLSQCSLMMQLDLSFNSLQGPLPPEMLGISPVRGSVVFWSLPIKGLAYWHRIFNLVRQIAYIQWRSHSYYIGRARFYNNERGGIIHSTLLPSLIFSLSSAAMAATACCSWQLTLSHISHILGSALSLTLYCSLGVYL